jgi:SAM-dependent methyltransferase
MEIKVHDVCFNNEFWELMWSPYDRRTYSEVLSSLSQYDIVLDIGAGDLRLARRIAERCKFVYAIELNRDVINMGINKYGDPIPDNLLILNFDARCFPFPKDVTCAVLLMRHCTNVKLYIEKLMEVGANRLITNARWRLGVEVIDLITERIDYKDLKIGSYGCICGSVGFKPGDTRDLSPGIDIFVNEVINCPACLVA